MKVSPSAVPKPGPQSGIRAFSHRYLGVGLTALAITLTGLAGVRWANNLGGEPEVEASTSDTRAWVTLGRSLHADSTLPFAARVQTVVFVGERGVQSEARLTRSPQHLAISYLSGPLKGQQNGYSQLYFWRQDSSGSLESYAHTTMAPEAMARRRFGLMRANYQARMQSSADLMGRPVQVIELSPRQPLRGARGPARRVFVDDATGLTLRTEAFNSHLQPVSHSTFASLNLHPRASEQGFQLPSDIAAVAQQSFWGGEELGDDSRVVAQQTGISPPQSDEIPRGWARDGFGVHRCQGPGAELQVAAFTRYTDGLNVLTLFAVKNPTAGEPAMIAELASTKSAPNTYQCSFGPGTLMSRVDGEGTLLALGDLPAPILRRVLKSARFKTVEIATAMPLPTTTVLRSD